MDASASADITLTVCMHCSKLWKLESGQWVKPSPEEAKEAAPVFAPIQFRYSHYRVMAAISGMELDDWLNLQDILADAILQFDDGETAKPDARHLN
jgi:hypothetical protein